MTENNRFYVYVYLDPRKSGAFAYGDFCFPFEPIYVGKGTRTRAYFLSNRNNMLSGKIRKFGKPVVFFVGRKLPESEAFELEKALIKTIGRVDLCSGTLCNLTDGGEGLFGFTHTDATKEKIGAANRGKPTWNKNGTMSPEWKEKISAKHKGKTLSEGHKKKLSDAHKGKPTWNKGLTGIYSEEVRKQMSAAHTGAKYSMETRKKMSAAHTGTKHSLETRKKMSESRLRNSQKSEGENLLTS